MVEAAAILVANPTSLTLSAFGVVLSALSIYGRVSIEFGLLLVIGILTWMIGLAVFLLVDMFRFDFVSYRTVRTTVLACENVGV